MMALLLALPLDASVVDGGTYDYVVVGGGTAGLTVTSRLSEDPSKRVLVIEAGGDNRTNPLIYDILQFTVALGGPMDWSWLADQNKTIHGGKTLGGSSSVNGASWTRGTKSQYDSWSNLLEPSEARLGWNWDGMLKQNYKAVGGLTEALAFFNIYELFGTRAHDAIQMIKSSLASWAALQADSALSADALRCLLETQASSIIDSKDPVVEFFWNDGTPDDLGIILWPLLPFSRGNVTILSADSFEKPRVIVNYFNVDFDLALHIEGCRLARKIFQSAAMSSLSAGETVPGFQKVPDNSEGGSEEDWAQWVLHDPQFSFGSVAHPIGTAAMMRRSLGGVVDARLKVYDTTNVRVVDASILPWQISAHLSSTIYGIVEKAADFIKSGV